MIKSLILIVVLAAGGLANLRKEEVADGECAVIPPETGDINFFTRSARGDNWHMVMASEYGSRYNAEILYGRPAHTPEELQFPEPLVILSVLSNDDPINLGLVVKDIGIKGECTPKKHSEFREYFCEVFRGVLNGKTDLQDPTIKWKLLGHPSLTIIKADPQAKYVVFNVCSTAQKTRYWLAISKTYPFPKEAQNKLKGEVKSTGWYNSDNVYILN